MRINKRNLLSFLAWGVVLFTSFEGFGLRKLHWGGLGLWPLGWYGILQLSVLIVSLSLAILYKRSCFFNLNNKLGLPAFGVYAILPIIIIVQSGFFFIFDKEPGLIDMLRNLASMKELALYFPLVLLLSQRNGIQVAVNSLVFFAILSSTLSILVIFSGLESDVITVSTAKELRILNPAAALSAFGFIYFMIKQRSGGNFWQMLASLLCFAVVLLQMHRSVLIAISFVIFLNFFSFWSLNFKHLLKTLIFSVLIASTALYVFEKTDYDKYLLDTIYLFTKEEITQTSGNFGVRYHLPQKSFDHVVANYYIFGVGLNWEPLQDIYSYRTLQRFYARPTYDSGYNNIIIIYGILGILVYLYLFVRLFVVLRSQLKTKMYLKTSQLSLVCCFLFIYTLLIGVASDVFLIQNPFMITLIIAITYSIENTRTNQIYDNFKT